MSEKDSMANDAVLVKEVSFDNFSVLLVELNRPSRLNAVNFDIINGLNEVFDICEKPNRVGLLILSGAGRAFCAGGDIMWLSKAVEDDRSNAISFLSAEYAALKRLRALEIPTIALADGACIGAGFGIWYACKIRVSTPKAIFAMPETIIALAPDVGASYFFTTLPGSLGLYFALTGNRLDNEMVQRLGMATHCIASESIPELLLLSFLSPDSSLDVEGVSQLLNTFAEKVEKSSNFALDAGAPVRRSIDSIFSAPSLKEIFGRLEKEESDWGKETLATLKAACPTALVSTFNLMRKSYEDTSDEKGWENAIDREKKVNTWLAIRKDFSEGVRCKLKDKNDTPKWDPGSVEEVKETREEHVRAAM
eukprot:Plantae.Rhodophyta-Hildenbrandia_rubra.ctg350.p4 GENE.Plantae.Rhodophyta-Hildenbrandia_rubra.ctg350~~Plantae.Rhodophyta-Hildenbrandia_rubra.ctg350.p4  ORF type:complete len:365 (-),score=88.43 Plantae.Rhodophyta-Hildenbrandia_rubra.ctg350:3745-4839(-)